MSELPFDPRELPRAPYGEMRCRRYLFDRAYGEEQAAPDAAASGRLAPPPVAGLGEAPERPQ